MYQIQLGIKIQEQVTDKEQKRLGSYGRTLVYHPKAYFQYKEETRTV